MKVPPKRLPAGEFRANGITMKSRVPRPGDTIHIPLKPKEAIRLLMQVRPTADVPRQGAAHPPVAKKKRAKKAK